MTLAMGISIILAIVLSVFVGFCLGACAMKRTMDLRRWNDIQRGGFVYDGRTYKIERG